MKKKIIRIMIIVIVSLLLIGLIRATCVYIGNLPGNKAFFEDEYAQIIYPTSMSDYLIAKAVLKEAEEAFSTITDDETAYEAFGKLGSFCITDSDAVREMHNLDFIAANFSNDSGYIWVKYSSEAYDKDGEVTFGTWDILSRWELEKVEDKWVVTSIKEHP